MPVVASPSPDRSALRCREVWLPRRLAPGLTTASRRTKFSHSPAAKIGSRSMRILLYPLLALGLFGAGRPQFRGPNGSGLCPSCGQPPTKFGPQQNVLWKTELPPGKSSPVLAGDGIFLTASEGDDLITMRLSRSTGKVQWRRSVRAARRAAQHTLNHRAAPTAAWMHVCSASSGVRRIYPSPADGPTRLRKSPDPAGESGTPAALRSAG